ncbi:MAG: lipoyltransferase and lipoate-protein ligase [Bacillales bacterium]|jgi:lipoate-protein ligase A|nr:lipoyltransferase and lipoate-protein ligase [Bacillales bacterium]
MKFIDNQGITDPTLNLALEEHILRNLDPEETYLLFYINEPSVIIGKNQNTIEEINNEYIEENKVHVVRRLSGGGAVYHDLGNLNFSFITKDDGNSFNNFKKFTLPVIEALHKLGVNAELSGRNDILVDGRKISGNAQFSTNGRMFSHGTLLFKTDMDNVVQALNVKLDKIQSKGIKSIRSRVANISEFIRNEMTIEEFRSYLIDSIFTEFDAIQTHELSENDWNNVRKLAEDRYGNWDWNYGKSPKSNVQINHRFPAGGVDIRLHVEKGIITNAKIFGDFFGFQDVFEIENALIGVKFDEASSVLDSFDLSKYFGNISNEEFINLFK